MAASLASADFVVPSVTEDDLRAFHTKHFAHAQAPLNFFTAPEQYQKDEEDDGLGYYADGVKCTLTAEQVAIFRHSEIQQILRTRRLRLENGTSESEDESTATATVSKVNAADSPAFSNIQQSDTTKRPFDENKRKWDDYIDQSEKNPEALTHRRLARELDELKAESMELAYGDEDLPSSSSNRSQPRRNGRKLISYDGVNEEPVYPQGPTTAKPQKKAFQWPTLGTASGGF